MKLVCPGCGITASAELWAEDAATRELLALVVKLPGPVQEALLPYLALFRPEKRALSMARALTLTRELALLVASGMVEHDGKIPRPCSPHLWAEGMREMARMKSGQKAHFVNHNYLRAVVYPLADKADAAAERRREENLRTPNLRDAEAEGGDSDAAREEAMAAIRKLGIKL